MANDNESAQHQMAIAKRQAELDRLAQQTEAFQNALKKVFKSALKDEDTRQKIHQETQNGKKGLANNPELQAIRKATGGQGGFNDLDDVETGFEKRYWEVEDD